MPETFKDWPRFDGSAAWTALSDDQQAEIGAIALEFVVNANGEAAYFGCDPCFHGEGADGKNRPFIAGESLLMELLMQAAQDALADRVPALNDDALPVPIPSLLGAVCRACGCSEQDACATGCRWVEDDLCSSCAPANAEQS